MKRNGHPKYKLVIRINREKLDNVMFLREAQKHHNIKEYSPYFELLEKKGSAATTIRNIKKPLISYGESPNN